MFYAFLQDPKCYSGGWYETYECQVSKTQLVSRPWVSMGFSGPVIYSSHYIICRLQLHKSMKYAAYGVHMAWPFKAIIRINNDIVMKMHQEYLYQSVAQRKSLDSIDWEIQSICDFCQTYKVVIVCSETQMMNEWSWLAINIHGFPFTNTD